MSPAMRLLKARWWFLPFLIVAVSSCGPRRVRSDLPREERGVALLTAIVLEYKDALRERRFEEAADLLEELEEGVAEADGITRSHPDFEDVALAAKKARPALERMLRKDAATKLVKRVRAELAAADRLDALVESAGPSSARLAKLRDATKTLADLLADGDELGDEEVWLNARPELTEKLSRYRAHVAEYGWVLRLTEELEPRLEAAVAAETLANGADSAAERLRAGREAVAAFADCRQITSRYREEPGYSDTIKIQTTVGEVSIDEAGLTCEFRRVTLEKRIATLEWTGAVEGVAGRVRDALGNLRAAQSPDARLTATGAAMEVLAECAHALQNADTEPGFDGSARFETPLGKLNALRLRDGCKREHDQLGAKNPTLQWRTGLSRLKKRAEEARTAAAAAKGSSDNATKVSRLSEALGGYEECMEQARFLGSPRAIKGAKPSARERAAAKKLGKSCKRQRERTRKLLTKAKAKAKRARPR